MNQPAKQPEQRQQQAHPATATGIEPMPAALRDSLKVAGVELSGVTQAAAHLLVTGTLAPASRFRYGNELGAVSQWCMEHELDLLGLSPQDIGALVVARRDAGQSPRLMLTALTFVYRHKRFPDESVCALARHVERVWQAQNRDRLPLRKQAPVLPLMCWRSMHAAAGDPDDISPGDTFGEERRCRNRLIISLGVTGGLRPGDLGRLSASKAYIDANRHLVLPMVQGSNGTVTKTGRSEVIVPIRIPPFDVLPLVEDFKRLQRLRLARPGSDDHLIADAFHHGLLGGLSQRYVTKMLRRVAHDAGIEDPLALTGHSLRRSMVHISAAAGWSLDQIAAVLGHSSNKTLEDHYLEGYGGSWCQSGEGRQVLLESTRRWADCPPNARNDSAATAMPDSARRPWWSGRDLAADRQRAEQIARGVPRVSANAGVVAARIGRRWEEFCAKVGADAARPTKRSLEGFAISLTKDSTASRCKSLHYLVDHFSALPSTQIGDLEKIGRDISGAVRLGDAITAANRKNGWQGPRRREIVRVNEEMMEMVFAQPLVNRIEGIRLLGLVLEQSSHSPMTCRQRQAFNFGTHTRVTPEAAMMFAPDSSTEETPALIAMSKGGDPLWCGYEAARSLIDHYPNQSLYSQLLPGTLTSRCAPVVRWLQARAAVAVAYATGLRPSDLDGIRWPDLFADEDGAIMWRLPYSKGNLVGRRPQVERLLPSDKSWCPASALQRLKSGLAMARAAGWQGRAANPDNDGIVRRVYCPHISQVVTNLLMKPAGLDLRLCDFRYHKATEIWDRDHDMQLVRSALFHRRTATSAGYVARGMTSAMRVATDPVSGMFDNA